MENSKIIRGNGKLLLTGEYCVLDGAIALALPTRYGQTMMLTSGDSSTTSWESIDMYNEVWLAASIEKKSGQLVSNDGSDTLQTLQKLLAEAIKHAPDFLKEVDSIKIKTDFPLNWGLGSSSTLVYTLCKAAGIDPFALQASVFGGSGYDIACAGSNGPLLFSRARDNSPSVKSVDFEPINPDRFAFIYLGKKQNSREAIQQYNEYSSSTDTIIQTISNISEVIAYTKDHQLIIQLLQEHEAIMSEVLLQKTVQELYFSDFSGIVKSLGAWGGDFVLAIHHNEPIDPVYFYKKGFPTVIPYKSMIL